MDWSAVAGTLVYKNNNLYLNIIVKKDAPKQDRYTEKEVLGIDRGINNILVCSNNQFFNSKKLKAIKGRYQYLKKMLQSKGTPSARRKLQKISSRERRFVTDTNHRLSKVIAESDFKVFAIEKLTRMNHKRLGKRFNRQLGNWSFRQFETFLEYKSEALGKKIMRVNPRYTSQKCSNCHKIHKSNRNGSWYSCNCGFQLHADLNASRNIADIGMSEISRLSVNQPNVMVRSQ
ncbi:IS200/IS605 family element transposase accessory protein TnpB [archaeon]|nr:IS200/IS605 family element transposase accessory protein TnpB [archaeon]